MKRAIVLFALLSTSTLLNAMGCGYLGVRVINESGYDCFLRNVTINNGGAFEKNVPAPIIMKGTSSATFYAPQALDGVDVKLDYRCENKVVSFTSHQNTCFFSAGRIYGYAEITNDLGLEQQAVMGSYLRSRPGEITWTIH